jgi:squalene-hopene/tetraprenyl-beta-curcumene cyclase
MKFKLYDSVQSALSSAASYSYKIVRPEGYWCGEVVSNVTTTATYVFLHQALGMDMTSDKEAMCQYILSEQSLDGSWTNAYGCPGNVSCSIEAYLALKIMGVAADSYSMCRARDFVLSQGGVEHSSMFTRTVLAG